jgi:phosphopantothenoylcysteine decarboxylase/phosphopantothenate--cysteine ligase
MASLTVRQLDEKVKKLLRLRAARHGRSMEDEIRTILGQAATGQLATGAVGGQAAHPAGRDAPEALPAVAPPAPTGARGERRRVLLIIGGGIAAYKSLDLIRRLQDRGAAVRCVLTKAAQEFVTPLAAGARHRSRCRRARHRRPDGENGGRPCRRSRQRRAARHRQADPDRARDESDDVVAQGDAAQPRATDR